MKRDRFSEEQNIAFLRQVKVEMRVVDLCRQHGISVVPFYKGGKARDLDVSEARRLRQPEEKNGQLKKMVAEQALGISSLKDVSQKTSGARVRPRGGAIYPKGIHRFPAAACVTLGVNRSTVRRQPSPDKNADQRRRLRELAEERVGLAFSGCMFSCTVRTWWAITSGRSECTARRACPYA